MVETQTLTYSCRTDGCEREGRAVIAHWCPGCGLPNDPDPGATGPVETAPTGPAATLLLGQPSGLVALGTVIGLCLVALLAARAMVTSGGRQPAGTYTAGDYSPAPTAPPVEPATTDDQYTTTTWTSSTEVPTTETGPPVELAGSATATASATAPSNVDDGGNTTNYDAANILDDDPTTAWRVKGNGDGVTLTVTLPEEARLTEVGLIPGYAKIDPASGIDRFAQERRLRQVRWVFDDGTTIEQDFDDQPTMQRQTVEVTTTEVVIEIVQTTGPGDRDYDYTAISEISITGTASQ